ncbi:glutathione ABC transporter substrate-binding protein [Savagea faecisuis]|uniref:Glutathione ABC transporter substrate-binding protein n=1 Tax=Savagea faecisuis TaxID=1274803 RepID=A0ABW3H2K1_9BACL
MHNKKFLVTALFAIFALVLAACSGGSDDKPAKENEEGQEQSEGKEGGDLVVAVLSDAATLDPQTATDVPTAAVLVNVVEGLVTKDENDEIVPALAKSWENIDDLTWEFKLQEGVKFHDGEDFTAEVVKKNFERILDPEVAAPRAFLFEVIEEVKVIDDHTVQIITEYPFAPLLAHLNHPVGVMLSPALIEADYEGMKAGRQPGAVVAEGPIGTGMFKFKSWNPDDAIVLERNDDYWQEGANVDTITFKVVPESGTRVAELETGYAHLIEPVQPSEVTGIETSGKGTVDVTDGNSLSYVAFNTEKAPFDNPKVRQAISMLINTDEILTGIYDDYGQAAKGPLAPSVFGYSDKYPPLAHDIEKAKQLLEEAGLGDGFKTSIWTNDNPQRIETAVLLQQKLKEVNVDVEIEQMEWGTYLDKTANGEHEMFILGLSNPVGDADYFLTQLFHSKNKGASGNRSFYDNPEVDRLLDEARQEIDEAKRIELYEEVQKVLIEDAPMVYVYHQAYLTGVSNDIDGYWINSSGHYMLKDVKFK